MLLLLSACGRPPLEPVCVDLLQSDGSPSGTRYCWGEVSDRGRLDRAGPVACVDFEPPDPGAACTGASVGGPDECATNGDCGTDGQCGGVYDTCICVSLCASDAACAPGTACACTGQVLDPVSASGASFDQCLPAGCTTGADCPSGTCGVSEDSCGVVATLQCRSDADHCGFDSDCERSEHCRWTGARFECSAGDLCD